MYTIYVEKKEGISQEATSLQKELQCFLGIHSVQKIRIFQCYEVDGVSEEIFVRACQTIFSEPPVDVLHSQLPQEGIKIMVEALPGQFDQRADSAAQCIQMLTMEDRPVVRYRKVYILDGELSEEEKQRFIDYVVNPVESRLAQVSAMEEVVSSVEDVPVIDNFTNYSESELKVFLNENALAMDMEDLKLFQRYFQEEGRQPTLTEIKVVDTYWSDHCRHTTFSTQLQNIDIEDNLSKDSFENYLALREEVYGEKAKDRPITFMDMATIAAKVLKKRGLLHHVDESEEVNACCIKLKATINHQKEDYLLMFKNETHNHPTEIEPFGGAATCIGGCIRDPLSGRAYVHQAMRISGAADPRTSLKDTIEGKLPQKTIVQTAAAGYSSYGNQIGLATGFVKELYHPNYVAKHLECGAVLAAAPAANVVRETPQPKDVVLLLGGRTGRDGIGGATGSSKSHDMSSLQTMAAEVQKGNAPEERKIQRLFRNPEVTRMIKRCNDFGAGGVSVAIGELADGLRIDLDAVRKKYDGLNGTEIALSESQERMAVVVSPEDVSRFIAEAHKENLEAYPVAEVTEEKRVRMYYRSQKIVDLHRHFLDSQGARKYSNVKIDKRDRSHFQDLPFTEMKEMLQDLRCANQKGLVERFDATVGAGSVLLPYGGKRQKTMSPVMASLLPVLPHQHTTTVSMMAYGADPYQMEKDPYLGAYDAVVNSMTKLVAAGADPTKIVFSFQEFFEKLRNEEQRWGKVAAALLGALQAQMDFEVAAIGGKDSMSGSFLDYDVPPTFISFAVVCLDAKKVITSEFKQAGHKVVLFYGNTKEEIKEVYRHFRSAAQDGKIYAARAVEQGIAEAIFQMAIGNGIGFAQAANQLSFFKKMPSAIVAEVDEMVEGALLLGETLDKEEIHLLQHSYSLSELEEIYDGVLEDIFPRQLKQVGEIKELIPQAKQAVVCPQEYQTNTPKALIPCFPGTNSEYDTQKALWQAGADAEIYVIRNQSSEDLHQSVSEFAQKIRSANIIVIPGGFSGGDEPDGSAKFIAAFFRNPIIQEAIQDFLDVRKGLMLGICNGFQALIKLGLVPYGKICEQEIDAPTLTYNQIGRHQSSIVNTKIVSSLSPWFTNQQLAQVYQVAISHGEGRLWASEELVKQLAENGQIISQYVNREGEASLAIEDNPNGSIWAIEGICSPDGRVYGKMGHSERIGEHLYKNVSGTYDSALFRNAVAYFRKK